MVTIFLTPELAAVQVQRRNQLVNIVLVRGILICKIRETFNMQLTFNITLLLTFAVKGSIINFSKLKMLIVLILWPYYIGVLLLKSLFLNMHYILKPILLKPKNYTNACIIVYLGLPCFCLFIFAAAWQQIQIRLFGRGGSNFRKQVVVLENFRWFSNKISKTLVPKYSAILRNDTTNYNAGAQKCHFATKF